MMTMASSKEELPTEIDARSPEGDEAVAFCIRVLGGPEAGKSVIIEPSSPSSILVGKSAACQLVLNDARVSRRHVSLDVSGDRLRVQDLGSTNGTTVNGIIVMEAMLRGGETIGVGATSLHVERQTAVPSRLTGAVSFGRLIGASTAMRRLYPLCQRLAASDIPIVIEGETGTGKELLAEALHEAGPRASEPFVVFDCSTVAPNLVEGVLFGDEAQPSQRGVFEAAHQGTLLIDEITELAPPLQRKLLRAIERGEVCRVGSDSWMHVDVRVIATTRRDLEKEVEAERFREDLFFRLAVGRVELPPLRRRQSDVALLADYFWKRLGDEDRPLPHDFLRRYDGYSWPGNVRELQNAVARRLALGDADPDHDDAPAEPDGAPENAFRWVLEQDLPFTSARDLVANEFVRHYVEAVLEQHGGNVSRAAAASGLARRYFQILRARQRR
jgi:DNA-binding NtrC family response regulator